jgi:SOS-response transcriptional repressor LexA
MYTPKRKKPANLPRSKPRVYGAGFERRLLKAIKEYWEQHGHGPSMRDLADVTDCSSTSVLQTYLEKLRAKGQIQYDYGISRSVRLIGDGVCPCCGREYERERNPMGE